MTLVEETPLLDDVFDRFEAHDDIDRPIINRKAGAVGDLKPYIAR